MKNGFTLVELLAVLVIIALLIAFTIPSYVQVHNNVKRSALNSKMIEIQVAANKYGELIKDSVKNDGCKDIKVEDLIKKGYLSSDSDLEDVLINPLDNKKMENKVMICYCTKSFDINSHYINHDTVDPYKTVINKGEFFIYENKLYEAKLDYKPSDIPVSQRGIGAKDKHGKAYFEELEC